MFPASAEELVDYFFFLICFCLCMSALRAPSLCTTCVQCSRRPEEGAVSPGAGIADGPERPRGCYELKKSRPARSSSSQENVSLKYPKIRPIEYQAERVRI